MSFNTFSRVKKGTKLIFFEEIPQNDYPQNFYFIWFIAFT